jgi:preprotein translocase subunit SecE
LFGTVFTDKLIAGSELRPILNYPAKIEFLTQFVSIQMNLDYFNESYNELIHKVSWPTWSELRNSAVVVMVASFIIALLIFLIDSGFRGMMKLIYSFFY